jgi:hypothetical protein
MKIPIRLLCLFCLFAFYFNTIPAHCQTKFGPIVGLNFSELPNNSKYIIGKHHIYNGYHLGAIAELRLFDQLFLQPGFLITVKGSKYIVGNDTAGSTTGFSDFQFSCSNAEIPLDLIYKFDRRSFKLLLIAGPHFGYGLTGKWEASYGTSSKVHFGNNPEDDLKAFDYGLDLGAGVEFGRIQVSSQYYLGLKTLSTLTPPLKEQKYRVLSISIAYLFGKEEKVYNDYERKFKRKYSQNKGRGKKHQ